MNELKKQEKEFEKIYQDKVQEHEDYINNLKLETIEEENIDDEDIESGDNELDIDMSKIKPTVLLSLRAKRDTLSSLVQGR